MTEIVSIKFKSSGKNYYFSPNGLSITDGDTVIVETSKGLEIAECTHGNRFVEDSSVVQPLRPVVRVATAQDLKTAEYNKSRERDALAICQKKIEEHGLDMKLVDVECSFDGSKTLFFFTSDGRVDFRELVKDLAGIFHNRIELRQIGVRDEAKMLGGIGICGRPYCCHSFLNDFAPVSTKMAKTQNLSLNPAKISGSCGRLMCCLRYEQEAYEELLKNVPKVGAFVETTEGYGTAVAIDLLRQRIKVHLENDSEDAVHLFKAREVAAVPGGRPKEGEPYPHILQYVPEDEEPEEPKEDPWTLPTFFVEDQVSVSAPEGDKTAKETQTRPSRRRNAKKRAKTTEAAQQTSSGKSTSRQNEKDGNNKESKSETSKGGSAKAGAPKKPSKSRRHTPGPSAGKNGVSNNGEKTSSAKTGISPDQKAAAAKKAPSPQDGSSPSPAKKKNNRRRFYGRNRKPAGGNNTSSNS